MKITLKSTLLMIFAVSLIVFTNCDKAQINEAVNPEDVSSIEKQSLLKIMEDEYDCYGWAVWETKLRQYSKRLGYIPSKEFSTTSNRYDACIVEWEEGHSGYIQYQTSYYIKVSEWWNHSPQVNYYYPPFNHPDAGPVEYWWEKDPPPLLVSISGPTILEPSEAGTFTAIPKDGAGTYSNYRWWKRNDEGKKSEPKAPPPGVWFELDEWEGYQTIRQCASYDFSLKCRVYDVWGGTAEDIHQVIAE